MSRVYVMHTSRVLVVKCVVFCGGPEWFRYRKWLCSYPWQEQCPNHTANMHPNTYMMTIIV